MAPLFASCWLEPPPVQVKAAKVMCAALGYVGLVGETLATQMQTEDIRGTLRRLLGATHALQEWLPEAMIEHWVMLAQAHVARDQRLLQGGRIPSALSPNEIIYVRHRVKHPLEVRAASTSFAVPLRGLNVVGHKQGKLDSLEDKSQARLTKVNKEPKEWTEQLIQVLTDLEAPVFSHINLRMNPARALQEITGKARTLTIKQYVKTGQGFTRWLFAAKGRSLPMESADMVDYILHRSDGPCGPSIPLLIVGATSWIEKIAQVTQDRCWENDQAVGNASPKATERLSRDAPMIRRATRFYTLIMVLMENYVVNVDVQPYLRGISWLKLVKMWGCLRYDFQLHMAPHEIRFSEGRLTVILMRTKTSGASRRVRELPVRFSQRAHLFIPGWLKTGFDLWKEIADFKRDYFLLRSSAYRRTAIAQLATHSDAAEASAERLRDLDGIPGWLSDSYMKHSKRNLPPSVLTILEKEKTNRDMLGRWRPEGPDIYARTYNAAVANMLKKFVAASTSKSRYDDLSECDVGFEAATWLCSRTGRNLDDTHATLEEIAEIMRKPPGRLRPDSGNPILPSRAPPPPEDSDEEEDREVPGWSNVNPPYEAAGVENQNSEVCKLCWPGGREGDEAEAESVLSSSGEDSSQSQGDF
ncbi:unnamed protein product [Polarella glacialis]|uniref:Uncharacterized protein n=1 Tax=Polarella glacialis TaxID=89957 RepID=A0A813EYN7_POLGL|nr:unnamed protein product [Polarella glacialis]